MKKIVASVVVVVLFAISGGSAQAGILGYAHTAYTNFEIRTDTFGAERTLDVSDLASVAFADSSNASATLSGFVGVATASPTADVTPAQLNIALANDTFAQQAAGSEPFSRGDTGGMGALISGLGVVTAPAAIDTMAEVQLVNSANGALGTADSRVGTNAAFSFTTLGGINFIIDFDAALDLEAMLDVPFGEAAEAASGFSITVTDDNNADAIVFLWSPNGTGTALYVGVGGSVTSDPYSINQGVSQIGVNGTTVVSEASQNFRANVMLAAGSYTVNINATSDVSASTTLIPEPTSFLVWGLTGVVVLVGARRRRRFNQV